MGVSSGLMEVSSGLKAPKLLTPGTLSPAILFVITLDKKAKFLYLRIL